jgi:hypothetical protein
VSDDQPLVRVFRQPVTGRLVVLETRTGRVLPRRPTVEEAWEHYQERLGSRSGSEEAAIKRAYFEAWKQAEG